MKKLLVSLLCAVMMVTFMPSMAFAAAGDETAPSGEHVAAINGTEYETLNAAIEKVQDGETINILKNIDNALGISVHENKNFTIDFQNHEYVLTGPGAGSQNTETNGFQLLKGSTITFKNGTIRIGENPNNIKRIIQNYADLTLENMQIYAKNQVDGEDYALSINNGTVTFKGNTSVHTTSNDTIAFDVCKFDSYPSAKVIFDNDYTGTINGKISYDAQDAESHTLTINGNGNYGGIVLSKDANPEAAKNAIKVSGGTISVGDAENLKAVMGYLQNESNATLELTQDIEADGSGKSNNQGIFTITKKLTIDGKGHKVTAKEIELSGNSINGPSIFNVEGPSGDATFKNLIIDGNNLAKHGLNIYNAKTSVYNVTVKNCNGYGVVCNSSDVTVNGITTSGNGWGGINVDTKVDGEASNLTFNSGTLNEENSLYIENAKNVSENKVEINGGTFKGNVSKKSENDSSQIIITGGEFNKGIPSDATGMENTVKYVKTDGTVILVGINGIAPSATPGYHWEQQSDGSYVEVKNPYIPPTPTTQKPILEHDATVKVELSAYGTIATITVADGYELADVVLNGKSLGKVTTVTDLKTGDKLVITTVKKPAEFDVNAALDGLKLTARSSKTSKKNIKVVVKMDDQLKAAVEELKANGYTVKYKFYRSVKKASKYTGKLTKSDAVYTNTAGKKGTMYYYKARLQVYDAAGKLVDRTELKQCRYANRLWSK